MSVWNWPNSKVIRVIDGDTVVVELQSDTGFGGRFIRPVSLRLNRIDSFLRSSARGTAAAAAMTDLVSQPVHVQTLKGYKFMGTHAGETVPAYMAEITLPDGRNVSDEMVSGGHAIYWDGTGPRPAGEVHG